MRSALRRWLLNPPTGWRVEPVYATAAEPYRYARQFTSTFLGIPHTGYHDEPADFLPGDIFFVLDMQPQVQTAKADLYQHLRQQGATVKFLVHDPLCVLQPQHFLPADAETWSQWLQVVAESDGAICFSQAVADELHGWMEARTFKRLRRFKSTRPRWAPLRMTCSQVSSRALTRIFHPPCMTQCSSISAARLLEASVEGIPCLSWNGFLPLHKPLHLI